MPEGGVRALGEGSGFRVWGSGRNVLHTTCGAAGFRWVDQVDGMDLVDRSEYVAATRRNEGLVDNGADGRQLWAMPHGGRAAPLEAMSKSAP